MDRGRDLRHWGYWGAPHSLAGWPRIPSRGHWNAFKFKFFDLVIYVHVKWRDKSWKGVEGWGGAKVPGNEGTYLKDGLTVPVLEDDVYVWYDGRGVGVLKHKEKRAHFGVKESTLRNSDYMCLCVYVCVSVCVCAGVWVCGL